MSVREVIQRILWMFKVKDCKRICLFCEYYSMCRAEGTGGGNE